MISLPIPGFHGYLVDALGRVWSIKSRKFLKTFINKGGYSVISLKGGEKRKTIRVHQLVMIAFVGRLPKQYEINHINAIKTDNRLINLEYCTHAQNMAHAAKLGLMTGPKIGGEGSIRDQMRELRRQQWPADELADKFKCTFERVYELCGDIPYRSKRFTDSL